MNRREFLCKATGIGGTLALSACGLFKESEKRLGAMHEIQTTTRRVFEWNGDDFYLDIDDAGRPYVLSLICTHKQCTVAWKPDLDRFICPCHRGEYDRSGQVLKGKPPRALNRYRLEERADGWWLLNELAS